MRVSEIYASIQGEGMRTGQPTQFLEVPVGNTMAIVDVADYDLVMQFHWYAVTRRSGVVYAERATDIAGKPFRQLMHRLIVDFDQVDHRDGNGLNNTRNNLRQVSHTQNLANARKRKGCSSQYKGVYWYTPGKKWKAQTGKNKGNGPTHLGYFFSEEEAALAYDAAARLAFGEFARLNFPQEGEVGCV